MATAPSAATIKERFPEFASVDDAAVDAAAATALTLSSVSPEATRYLTAHLLALNAQRGTGVAEPDGGDGIIMSEGVGSVRVGYKTQARDEGDVFFARTEYGRTFLALERRAPGFALRRRVF